MSYTLELLNELRGRPLGMRLGATSLLKLADYLRGAQHGIEIATRQRDPFLDEFREWIQAKFSPHHLGWEKLIVQQCKDEVDAIDRFWQLLDEYVKEREISDNKSRSQTLRLEKQNLQSSTVPGAV